MQLEYWQLSESPFRNLLDADDYYPSVSHDEALARLEYLVDARRRLGVLLGESGVGKSLALRVAAQRLARKGAAVAVIDAVGISTRDLLWQIAAGLGAAPRDAADLAHLWRLVADRVAENRLQQTNTVLMVDDTGQAEPDVLTQLMRLARLDATPAARLNSPKSARWTILLAAEPDQAARWNESLRELVDLRIDLEPWSESDTIGYVQTSLVEAGRFDPVFDDEGLAAIYELTGGVPRRVIRLADLALLAGAAAAIDTIDAATVHGAYSEMSWPTVEAAY
jgi:type II secretory pathway predicted ATPase ExeA